jgi:hypothetical protein
MTTETPVADDAPGTPVARPSVSASESARRFRRASLGGGVVAMAVLGWLATAGADRLFDAPRFGNFYDAQARSLFHGRWDMPASVLEFERFNVGGKFHMYFGPVPALLRMPVLAVTDAFDGELTRISIIAAGAVLVVAVARLSWLARRSVFGDAPVSRVEAAVAAGIVIVALCGTTVPYLAGRPIVYHEAILWGIAFALVSFGALAAWLFDGRTLDLVVAGAGASLSVLSRGSVGLGPITAIVLVLVVRVVKAVRGHDAHWRPLAALGAACVVPLGLYAYVNSVKFGTLVTTPPVEQQDLLLNYPPRVGAMEANGGSLFGMRYAPTILFHYLRPDGVDLDRLFPFVLLRIPTRVFGGTVFESLRPTASITAASPLALIATIGGTWCTLARRAVRNVWLAPLVGCAVGAVGAVSLAFVDQRYQGDLVPLLVVPGIVGAWAGVHLLRGRSRGLVATIAAVAVVLGLWSVWANFSTAYVYQRAQALFSTVEERASLVRTQLDVHDALDDGLPSRVTAGDALPADETRAGSLFLLGECDGVYRHDGFRWHLVEQTSATGAHRLVLRLDPAAVGRQPVLSTADDAGTTVLWARNLPRDRVGFEYEWQPSAGGGSATRVMLPAVERRADGSVDFTATVDFPDGFTPALRVRANGESLLDDDVTALHIPFRVGRQDTARGATSFAGDIDQVPTPTPLCDRLIGLGLRPVS